MAINPKYKPPKTDVGDLNTPISFFGYKPSSGPEPGDEEDELLYKCWAEVYNPSMKDMEIMNSTGTKEAVTISIRDPHGDYLPINEHKAELDDYRYRDKIWEIVSVGPDVKNNNFIKIILGLKS